MVLSICVTLLFDLVLPDCVRPAQVQVSRKVVLRLNLYNRQNRKGSLAVE